MTQYKVFIASDCFESASQFPLKTLSEACISLKTLDDVTCDPVSQLNNLFTANLFLCVDLLYRCLIVLLQCVFSGTLASED